MQLSVLFFTVNGQLASDNFSYHFYFLNNNMPRTMNACNASYYYFTSLKSFGTYKRSKVRALDECN
jgi:hypothetical protein